jgi:hypothetical protein
MLFGGLVQFRIAFLYIGPCTKKNKAIRSLHIKKSNQVLVGLVSRPAAGAGERSTAAARPVAVAASHRGGDIQ